MIQKAKREEIQDFRGVNPSRFIVRILLLFRFQFLQPPNIQDSVGVLQGRLGEQNCIEAQARGVWKVLHTM